MTARSVTARLAAAALAAALAAPPALAQNLDLGKAGSQALQAVRGAAQESLLVGDLIGATVNGPSGEKLGTVRNLVAVPGGQLVAVVLAPDDLKHPIFIPYKAAKIAKAADAAPTVELSQNLDQLRSSKAVSDLTDALGGLIPGTPKAQQQQRSGGSGG